MAGTFACARAGCEFDSCSLGRVWDLWNGGIGGVIGILDAKFSLPTGLYFEGFAKVAL